MEKPIINEVFTDNGEHSHWELINAENGELLWSEDITESDAIRGEKHIIFNVVPPHAKYNEPPINPFIKCIGLLDELKEHIVKDYIPTDDTINEVLKHIPKYFTFDKSSGRLVNHNTQRDEGIDGDTIIFQTYVNGERKEIKGTVEGYTDYQIVKTYEHGSYVLNAEDGRYKTIIKNKKWNKCKK
jgi:hypothetical protein